MAHLRKRHMIDLYRRLMAFSPIVGVFGHRQVGKSTFISERVGSYVTLDDVDQLEFAHARPKDFINDASPKPFAIDECQLEPKLFPTLKEWVRTHKKPGQFVLSGSVRFTSRVAIRESLAGRMAFFEVFPLSVGELAEEGLSEVIPELLRHQRFSNDSLRLLPSPTLQAKLKKNFQLYLDHGGLPGLCFIRDMKLKASAFNDLHDLILGRDLRLISDLKTSATTLKRLLRLIAQNPFEIYNAAEVGRSLGLAPQTQKKILYAMESAFLIRRISVMGSKKEMILLEDQFEERVYGGAQVDRSKHLESAVYRNIRTQFGYRLEKSVIIESYLTRDHARVPIVLQQEDEILGIIVCRGLTPSLSEIRSGDSFLKKYARAKLLYLYESSFPPAILDERRLTCSIYSVL